VALTSLADLDALASVGGRIIVRDTGVPATEVQALLTRLGR
jgi:hypothetical protein